MAVERGLRFPHRIAVSRSMVPAVVEAEIAVLSPNHRIGFVSSRSLRWMSS